MGLADGSLTRGQALKYMGAALLGGLGALAGISSVTDEADAKRRKKRLAPTVCPGQGVCPPGFVGNAGCCPLDFLICCPASAGGGCCPSGFTICLGNNLCGRPASDGSASMSTVQRKL